LIACCSSWPPLSAKLLPDNKTGQARSLATVTLENLIMNKHNLHYIDLNPEALPAEEPSSGTILLWAGFAVVLVYLLAIVLFSL
jgi:hypothetical protein